ncbi:lamin tail domain-containing protein 2 [Rhineura floridana]|uniref:lamin tail domain-containing protein 2 n=1 Tax=Rhineura floridana TaxID=261503 RepID=UPI002AC83282|nr:lamin tail domain-containing protein 2 [Rhineura floridana]
MNSQFMGGTKREHSVITRLSVMFNPRTDNERDDSSSPSPPVIEPLKESTSLQQNPDLMENPRTLLMVLHQRDLEIKGLKNTTQRDKSDRLGCILRELVKTKQKLPPKRSPKEEALKTEVNQLNAELRTIKEQHDKEIKLLEDKLVKSKLHIMCLQDTVKTLSGKTDDERDSESSIPLDEGAKLACECFELWSETGSKITTDTSDLRLRRIPKHTSFADAFNKFGSAVLSEEEKDDIIAKLETAAVKAHMEGSSQESSTSEQSSLVVFTSQKSDLTSVHETKMIESSSYSLPSSLEKTQVGKFRSLDPWSLAQSGLTLGRLSDEETHTRFMSCPFTEERRRCHAGSGPLRIVSVHRKGKFVRVFNTLLNKEVDLSGYIIQQWVRGYPVSIYRFPNGTILPAQHHITVWAAGANLAHERPSNMPSGLQNFFKTGPECTTILCDSSGQTMSQYRTSHQLTAAAEAYNDNVDLSVDKFPLNEDEETFESLPSRPDVALFQRNRSKDVASLSGILVKRRYTRHFSIDSLQSSKILNSRSKGIMRKDSDTSSQSSSLYSCSSKTLPPLLAVNESSSSTTGEDSLAFQTWQPLNVDPEAREFKTTLDTTLPMVSLIGQKSARSKYGFKHMTYVPTTTDLHLRRYCPAR